MLAVASLKRSLEFDPVEQGVKRKRAEIKLPPTPFTLSNATTSASSSKQPPVFSQSTSTIESSLKSSSCTTLTSTTTSSSLPCSSSSSTDDTPMFTFNQTAQMCARFLREQDKLIREQYEQLLSAKLNEQYEQFVRYSHDSVHRKSSKQQLFHFGQQQESDKSSITSFSYVS